MFKLLKFLLWLTYYFYLKPLAFIRQVYTKDNRKAGSTTLSTFDLEKTRLIEKVLPDEVNHWERWCTGTENYVALESKKRLIRGDRKKIVDFRWLEDEQRYFVNVYLRKSFIHFRTKLVERTKVWGLYILNPFWLGGRVAITNAVYALNLFIAPVVSWVWQKFKRFVIAFFVRYKKDFVWFAYGLFYFLTSYVYMVFDTFAAVCLVGLSVLLFYYYPVVVGGVLIFLILCLVVYRYGWVESIKNWFNKK